MSFEAHKFSPEKIEAAALRVRGKLFTGTSHLQAIEEANKDFPDWETSGELIEDGFLTDRGRFVDRREAGRIAEQANQLDNLDEGNKEAASSRLESYHITMSPESPRPDGHPGGP
jgi:hypothetical protein